MKHVVEEGLEEIIVPAEGGLPRCHCPTLGDAGGEWPTSRWVSSRLSIADYLSGPGNKRL